MQGPANDQRRVLLLAGTGDGPRLVKELFRRNWRVSVSVVTATAAKAYAGLPVEHISIGALQGIGGIKAALHQAGPFRWVVDATHPFAARISHDLSQPVRISTNRCCVMSVALNRLELPLWWRMPKHWPPSRCRANACCWPSEVVIFQL